MYINPSVVLTVQDPNLDTQPTPVITAGKQIIGTEGLGGQEIVLPALTASLVLPYPIGITTAKLVAVQSVDATDLIVNYGSQPIAVPQGQVVLLYNVDSGDLTLNSVLGGKIIIAVGA